MIRTFRRRLADGLSEWSVRLDDWSHRVRPRYVRPAGEPETMLERMTRETMAHYYERNAADIAFIREEGQWPPAEIGTSLRIRLPPDYETAAK